MKVLKLISGLLLLTALTNIYGSESESKTSHTPYISYDINQYGPGTPSVGYRYQKDDIILDASVGYKYLLSYSSYHFGTATANIFYSFWQTKKIQMYAGIGCTVNYMKGKDYFYYDGFNGEDCKEKIKINDFAICPAIAIGQDISIGESKKIFMELFYRPWSFGNGYKGKLHMTGIKIGIGI